MIIGITAGAFDLLHAGHVIFLEKCRNSCDKLVVCLQTDPSIERPHKNKPIQSVFERYQQLEAVKYVDQILPYETEDDFINIMLTRLWAKRFLDHNYKDTEYTGHDLMPEHHIFIPRHHRYSTTELRERVARSHSIEQ